MKKTIAIISAFAFVLIVTASPAFVQKKCEQQKKENKTLSSNCPLYLLNV